MTYHTDDHRNSEFTSWKLLKVFLQWLGVILSFLSVLVRSVVLFLSMVCSGGCHVGVRCVIVVRRADLEMVACDKACQHAGYSSAVQKMAKIYGIS